MSLSTIATRALPAAGLVAARVLPAASRLVLRSAAPRLSRSTGATLRGLCTQATPHAQNPGQAAAAQAAVQAARTEVMPLAAAAIGGGLLLFGSEFVTTVPANHVGIVDTLGVVSETPLSPGLHFKSPLAKVHTISLQTRKIETSMKMPTKEGLLITVDGSILYRVKPEGALELYTKVGSQFEDVVVMPKVRSAVRNVASDHESKDFYMGDARVQMQREFQERIQSQLQDNHIQVEDVLMKNIELPTRVAAAIEEKLRAEQENERMKFMLEQERQEAKRKEIEAAGIAEFQKIVSDGVSPQLLQWKGIEATIALANSPNAKMVVVGNGKDGLPVILSDTNAGTGKSSK